MKRKLENQLAKAIRKSYPSAEEIYNLIDTVKSNYSVKAVDDAVLWVVYYTSVLDDYDLFCKTNRYYKIHGNTKFLALLYNAFQKSHWLDMKKFIVYCKRW